MQETIKLEVNLRCLSRPRNYKTFFMLNSAEHELCPANASQITNHYKKKGKRKVQGVPQSQTAALPRPQEEEETDKSKQAQIEQT